MRANADGLMGDGPLTSAFIDWRDIVSIERSEDTTPYYEVEGDVGYTVKWPVRAPNSLTCASGEAASRATPERRAEIVMARSGAPITTRARCKRVQRAGV
jgi:hypothetical protein